MAEPVRILFIGEIHSSHARGWISLLSVPPGRFDIRAAHLQPRVIPSFPMGCTGRETCARRGWRPRMRRILCRSSGSSGIS